MKTLLKNHFKKYISFSDEALDKFCELFEEKSVKKKDFLLSEGEICRFEAFVVSGLFKVFHLDLEANEQTLFFATNDWWITDFDSFDNQIPSKLNIQALEDSQILFISKEKKEKAFADFPFLHELFHKMTKKTHIALQRRMLDSLCKTATERYWEYLAKYPHIATRLSNIQMASYLGVSHEFVSKIRSKSVREKK